MLKKILFIIPLLLLEVMIQLGFFWLAPAYACRWVVYSFLTAMTVAHLTIIYVIMMLYGTRKAAATIVAGSFVQILNIGASVFLIAVNSSVRSALFLMMMLTVLYAAVVTILWILIEGFGDNSGSTLRTDQNNFEDENDSYRENDCREVADNRPPYVNVPQMSDDRYGAYHSTEAVDRGTTRRTPPPVPVRY